MGPGEQHEEKPAARDGAARVSIASAAGRNRLLADAKLIEALVRIDEIEVAVRAIEQQRADLAEYAIDLREAFEEAVRERDAAAAGSAPAVDTLGEPA